MDSVYVCNIYRHGHANITEIRIQEKNVKIEVDISRYWEGLVPFQIRSSKEKPDVVVWGDYCVHSV